MKNIVLISLVIFFVKTGYGWQCFHCEAFVADSCRNCTNCGAPKESTYSDLCSAVDQSMKNQFQAHPCFTYQASMHYLAVDSGNPSPLPVIGRELCSKEESSLSINDPYMYLKKKMKMARKKGRNSSHWKEIYDFSLTLDCQNNAYFFLVKIISMRFLGKLNEAIFLLTGYLRRIINSDSVILSVSPSELQIIYEAAFISYLRHQYDWSVYYYYIFFVNREDAGISKESVSNAIHSAQILLQTNPMDEKAKILLSFCWSRLKGKLGRVQIQWFISHGYL